MSLIARAALAFGLRELDDHGRLRRGTWMQTLTGQKFFPFDPRPDEIHHTDMVIGVARECRFGNQPRRFYSVAEHEILVSHYAGTLARERGYDEDFVLAVEQEALLHDSSEAWIRDMIRPIKHTRPMRGYRRMERRIQCAVFERYGVVPTPATTAFVKEADNRLLVDEIHTFMANPAMYLERHERVTGFGAHLVGMEWVEAARAFEKRYSELFG